MKINIDWTILDFSKEYRNSENTVVTYSLKYLSEFVIHKWCNDVPDVIISTKGEALKIQPLVQLKSLSLKQYTCIANIAMITAVIPNPWLVLAKSEIIYKNNRNT